MSLTPQMIDAMNKATGNAVPTNPAAPPTRADEVRALAKKATVATQSTPGFLGRVANNTVEAAKSGIQTGAEGLDETTQALRDKSVGGDNSVGNEIKTGYDVAMGGVKTGVSAIGTLFSPVEGLFKTLSDMTKESGNEDIVNILSQPDAHPELIQKIKDTAARHPELAKGVSNLFGVLGLETGGAGSKIVKDAGEQAVKMAPKAIEGITDGAVTAGQVGANGVKATGNVAKTTGNIVGGGIGNMWRNMKNYLGDINQDVKMRKALEAEKGPNAVRVLQETGSPEFVNLVDNTKGLEDLKAKREMLNVAEQRLKGTASAKLPRQVVADTYIQPRIDKLQKRLSELGKTIGDAKVDNTAVDTTDLVSAMKEEAKKQGVIVSDVDPDELLEDVVKGKDTTSHFLFEKAPGVSGIDQSRVNTIKGMFEGFQPDNMGKFTNTRAQLAATRKNLSDLTKRSDTAAEVVGPGGAVDNARRLIAQKIGGNYYQSTKDYSDIARVLEQLDPDLKVRLSEDATKEIANIKLSDYARRLLSNNASQAKSVFKSLDELYSKEQARTGGGEPVSKQDLADLVDFAGSVEEGFDITPRNSFFGQVKGATDSSKVGAGVAVDLATGMPINTVVNFMKEAAGKSGTSKKRSLEAMKAYLDEAISRQK